MARINVLDKNIAELIAAGEVIERPASIVKELLENSVDAGATAVTVEIKRGGTEFIRITDNGCGIEKEDVSLAFLRHATSKVKCQEDLNSIATLGFRGEALASVCAVAKVEMLTNTDSGKLGTRIKINGGETESLEDAGCPQGTTLIVRNLFYNVPARLKFLKKDVTEGNSVQGIVERIALSHPEISFRFIRDNKSVLHTAGDGKLLSAVYVVFGRDFTKGLLPVCYEYQNIRVEGFVTMPSQSRANRSMQHFFVNDRYVKSATCSASLQEAYKHAMMVSKFPACVLKLSLDYSIVDVNVHPAKIEIRFVNEKPVFEAVYFAVKSALESHDTLRTEPEKPNAALLSSFKNEEAKQTKMSVDTGPSEQKSEGASSGYNRQGQITRISAADYQQMIGASPKVSQPKPKYHVGTQNSPMNKDNHDKSDQAPLKRQIPVVNLTPPPEKSPIENTMSQAMPVADAFAFLDDTAFQKQEPHSPTEDKTAVPKKEETISKNCAEEVIFSDSEEPSLRYIGEIFKTYILFEVGERFVILDKHAAHERMLYERFHKELSLCRSQVLLSPLCFVIPSENVGIVQQYHGIFSENGFRLETEGNQVRVLEAPLILHKYDIRLIVEELIDDIKNCKVDVTPSIFEDLLHSMACRAAVKGGEEHTDKELESLAKKVYADPSIRHCPHGRPVGIVMSRYEIEKKLGRQP